MDFIYIKFGYLYSTLVFLFCTWDFRLNFGSKSTPWNGSLTNVVASYYNFIHFPSPHFSTSYVWRQLGKDFPIFYVDELFTCTCKLLRGFRLYFLTLRRKNNKSNQIVYWFRSNFQQTVCVIILKVWTLHWKYIEVTFAFTLYDPCH